LFVDGRTVAEDLVIETDVCIVGAGAAGITLAKEFSGRSFRVWLLESGGFDFDRHTQDLYQGENLGFSIPLDLQRLRYFGGATNHWGNYCRPLDDIDFDRRTWVAHSGWPFDKSHLDSYYERAQSICQLGPFTYEPEAWEAGTPPPRRLVGDRVRIAIFQARRPPLRFGEMYRDDILRATNITTCLQANVLHIETDHAARMVTRLRVGCLQGNKFWLAAKLFILATGGIENARLLLLSAQEQRVGLGNDNDLVGRFFMAHPIFDAGFCLPSDPFIPITPSFNHGKQTRDTVDINGHLSLSPETQHRQQLLGFNLRLLPIYDSQESLSALKRLLHAEFDRFNEDLKHVIGDIDGIATAAYGKVFKGAIPVKAYTLRCAMEQAPNPDSRVTLSPELDALGKPRVRLDWKLRPIDKRSLLRSLKIIGAELGRAGLGRLQLTLADDDDTWPQRLFDGGHHMGTTRMHVNPHEGVVDQHCRVHGIANLYVAGSSVFPTGGHANPTLTIVALAVRLADDVKGLMT
jgi:choline dehydrogenase-like flavoprotein